METIRRAGAYDKLDAGPFPVSREKGRKGLHRGLTGCARRTAGRRFGAEQEESVC